MLVISCGPSPEELHRRQLERERFIKKREAFMKDDSWGGPSTEADRLQHNPSPFSSF